ncbi:MAG TPA: hypothetical protein VNI02_03440, partial [Blastocatellia bacterium]|nr:hypothetical protein [Blastocatellia bacterium]
MSPVKRISRPAPGEELLAAPPRPRVPASLSPSRQPFLYITASFVTGILIDRCAAPPRWVAATLAIWSVAFSIKFVAGKKD